METTKITIHSETAKQMLEFAQSAIILAQKRLFHLIKNGKLGSDNGKSWHINAETLVWAYRTKEGYVIKIKSV